VRLLALISVVGGGAIAAIAALVALRAPLAADRAEYLVASIAPLADIVHEVAGERFAVQTLLPAGASPHTFEPTPGDIVVLSKARAFFRIGLGLELWADKLLAAVQNPSLRVVTVSEGVAVIRTGADEHHHHHGDEPHDAHEGHEEHGEHEGSGGRDHLRADGGNEAAGDEDNPHVWLDPVVAVSITHRVCDELSAIDSDHRGEYQARAEAYVHELEALDERYRRALASAPSRSIVVFHNAYPYLARRYGLDIVGVIEESPGKEPSARHVAALIDRIRASGARAVLVEPQFNPKLGDMIAEEAGVGVAVVDPLGAPERPKTMTYLGLMEFNLEHLVKALNGPQP
jgi:ABC-type Zn uptake system ZnuABC Zn-binding protein ZnuA